MQKSEALLDKEPICTQKGIEWRIRVIPVINNQPIFVKAVGFLLGLVTVLEDFHEVIEGRYDCVARK